MLNKDIIIKLTTKHNFKDMVLMCLENDIDFTEWYNEISKHAPDVVINYSTIDDEDTSFQEIYPGGIFYIPSGIKNETIKFDGAFNFYKYFYKIVKFDFDNKSLQVKATNELKKNCYKNWSSNSEEDFFGIDYNAHGIWSAGSKESYFVDADEITRKEYLDHKRGVLNKKLNKVNPKPKVEIIEKDNQNYVDYENYPILAC